MVKVVVPRAVPGWILRRLRSLPGISARAHDGELTLELNNSGGIRYKLAVIASVGTRDIDELAGQGSRRRSGVRRVLLASNQLSPQARQRLADAGVSWVERHTGVCHLVGPRLLLHVERGPTEVSASRSPRTGGRARPVRLVARSGVVVETILLRYRDRPIGVSDLAREAGTSPGLVSRILQRLEAEGALSAEGKGPRRRRFVAHAGELLDLWAREDPPVPDSTASLYAWAPSAERLYASLSELSNHGLAWAVTGTAAANLYAPTLTILPEVELWVGADIPAGQIAAALGAEHVDRGANVLIRQREGNPALHHVGHLSEAGMAADARWGALRLVSPARAYVESLHGPGRGPEVAQRLRDKLGY